MRRSRSSEREGLAVSGALEEHAAPEPLRPGVVAALGGKRGQVTMGQVAVDPLIDAVKPVGTCQPQDPPPALFRASRLSYARPDLWWTWVGDHPGLPGPVP
jgi:hypothetical protein